MHLTAACGVAGRLNLLTYCNVCCAVSATVICYFQDGFMPQIGMGNCRSNILDVRRDQQVLPGGSAANARGLATAMAEGNKKGARTGRPPFNRVLKKLRLRS